MEKWLLDVGRWKLWVALVDGSGIWQEPGQSRKQGHKSTEGGQERTDGNGGGQGSHD